VRRGKDALTFVVVAIALLVFAAPGVAAPKDDEPGGTGTSLRDPLFPQIGNTGYDARRYDIELDYDPAANRFRSARTKMVARATKTLSRFSLDFQDLDVDRVKVNGHPARFAQVEAKPDLSPLPEVTQPMKLVVRPERRVRKGDRLKVVVRYDGTPVMITDPDTSVEGWIPACHGPGMTPPCDGAFVVNQPIGAQGWFPSNNHPTDKASFDTSITVPTSHTAFGIGELASRTDNGDGTWSWSWSEDDPTSTYLTTATVGLFDHTETALVEESTGRALPVHNALDSSFTPEQKANVNAVLAETPAMFNFLSGRYGPYPYDSIGAVVDRTTGVGYALEVATKPHYSQLSSSGTISRFTHVHEIAHQWMGNTVTLETWLDIWFNEGWATWSEWAWDFAENGGPPPEEVFAELYETLPDDFWTMAPAVLDGDPANLFSGVVYDRGAMVVEGTRQILGEAGFAELIRRLLTDFRYDNISTEEFIELAEDVSGFTGARLAMLDRFYEQWLYEGQKPTILPADFGVSASGSAQPRSGSRAPTPPGSRSHPR